MNTLLPTLLVGLSLAQPDTQAGDQQMNAYLARVTREADAGVLAGATSRAEWEAKLPKLRQEYLDMLGLWPLPQKTPLAPVVTGSLEHLGIAIEKLHFQSVPGLYVTGNLYRPKEVKGRLPAILYVCGHSSRGRDGNKTAFQDHGLWFASNGYICLVIDTLQLGEIAGKHHGTYNLKRWWWQSAGYTPAGVECWNGVRAIDYLVTRPDVDADKIGVTGISGGGAATFWIAAADERVKVAVPVSGMSDMESYVTNKVINGHCDCMFLLNTYGWEWTTIAALVAPRPLLFANSDNDGIFPMDGNRRIIERLRRLYGMYDKPDLVAEHVSAGGHDYRPDLRMAIFKFMNKHLKNDTDPVKDADFKFLPGKELRVFPEDRDLPADGKNARIDETFVPRARVELPEVGKFDGWSTGLKKQLRERSFRFLPENVAAAKRGEMDTATTEVGITVQIWGLNPTNVMASDRSLAILVRGPEDAEKPGLPRWATGFGIEGEIAPRGILQPWKQGSPPNYVERSHSLLGRTVDAGRVHDIIAVAKYWHAESKGKRKLQLIGRGSTGVLIAYAALFEPSITDVVLVDPPSSHAEGPTLLNVLRVLDVPEALGLLAPRRLRIIGGDEKLLGQVKEIYRRAGAAEFLELR